MTTKPEIIYIGDPMCSWCWGISPVVERLAERSDVSVSVVVGGLRPGPGAEPLDDRLRSLLSEHWSQVAATTGQPFDHSFLDRTGWVYDTELPAIAVTTMRELAPQETLRFFTVLQGAFYRDGVDITEPAEYPALIADFPVDPDDFMRTLTSDGGRTRAWEDFATARELGALGFPTVLLRSDESIQVLSRGYAALDHFENQLAYWVEGRQPDSASEYTCSVEGADC
ncbi:MAG: DsbA family protein [Acidimicrobiia bacterium]|nr:DsbA family protein [Acidimicrobiia bacterium]